MTLLSGDALLFGVPVGLSAKDPEFEKARYYIISAKVSVAFKVPNYTSTGPNRRRVNKHTSSSIAPALV